MLNQRKHMQTNSDTHPVVDVRITQDASSIDGPMVQLVLDFTEHPTALEFTAPQAAAHEETFFDYEPTEEVSAEGADSQLELLAGQNAKAAQETIVEKDDEKEHEPLIKIDSGRYVEFAISMLKTCAEDLVYARGIQNNENATKEQREEAQEMIDVVVQWLVGAEAPFTIQQCAELLEHEMRIQSLDEIYVPEVGQRWKELSQWIWDDPQRAKSVLSAYMTVFANKVSNNRSHDEDLAQVIEDYMDAQASQRKPHRARQAG